MSRVSCWTLQGNSIDIRVSNNLIALSSAEPTTEKADAIYQLLNIDGMLLTDNNSSSNSKNSTCHAGRPGFAFNNVGISGSGSGSTSSDSINVTPYSSCAWFNVASVYYHQCRFEECSQVLWKLFQQVHLFNDRFSVRVCFFLLDSLLRSWGVAGTASNCTGADDDTTTRHKRFANVTSTVLSHVSNTLQSSSGGVGSARIDQFPGGSRDLLMLKLRVYKCKIAIFLGNYTSSAVTTFHNDASTGLYHLGRLRDICGIQSVRGCLSTSCLPSETGRERELLTSTDYQTILFMQVYNVCLINYLPICRHSIGLLVYYSMSCRHILRIARTAYPNAWTCCYRNSTPSVQLPTYTTHWKNILIRCPKIKKRLLLLMLCRLCI